jgi:hypothetical protein
MVFWKKKPLIRSKITLKVSSIIHSQFLTLFDTFKVREFTASTGYRGRESSICQKLQNLITNL